MCSLDFSQPLATLLRESTREAHEIAQKSVGATLLLSGRLGKDDYIRYLMMLWHVYDTFERALDRHATHPTLEPTYNPVLLARAPTLAADISHLLQVNESSWKSHPMHVALMASIPPGLSSYVSRIEEISNSAEPSPLLAHSYVRYLGDLSGGQEVRRTIAKAYNLDERAGLGLSFYAFKELRSSKPASQGDMKRIKEWFREGMNAGGNVNEAVKASVVEEAHNAFALNRELFTSISAEGTRTEATNAWEEVKDTTVVQATEKTYPLSQVVAVVTAVCLAHFILVVGGFTGDRGYQKLLAIERWLATF